jgi:hypothetical protein
MIEKFIPQPIQDRGGVWVNFQAFMEDVYQYFNERVNSIKNLYTPEQSDQPEELAPYVGAYISIGDNIQTIRQKTANAIRTNRYLPVFSEVYKGVIDAIVGTNAQIVGYDLLPEAFVIDQSLIDTNATIDQLNVSPFSKLKGQIFIDVQTDISANQIAAIRRQLQEICVMYFMIYIGKVVAITAAGFVIDTDTIDGTKITDFNIPVGNYFKIQYAIN